jgi:hypothetical protein
MSIAPVTQRIMPQQVSAAIRHAADGDGDGRTGAAAINDGDAAAIAAAAQQGGHHAAAAAPAPAVTPAPKGTHVDVTVA